MITGMISAAKAGSKQTLLSYFSSVICNSIQGHYIGMSELSHYGSLLQELHFVLASGIPRQSLERYLNSFSRVFLPLSFPDNSKLT